MSHTLLRITKLNIKYINNKLLKLRVYIMRKYNIRILQVIYVIVILSLFLLLLYRLNRSCNNHCYDIYAASQCEWCVYRRVPRVSRVLESVQYLLWTNKSLARFGDGEVNLMLGRREFFQEKDKELQRRLLQVFKERDENLLIGIPDIFTGKMPMNRVNYNFWRHYYKRLVLWFIKNTDHNRLYLGAHMSSPYTTTKTTDCELLDKVYDTFRMIWDNKDIIFVRANHSQVYDYDIFDNVKSIKIIYCPPKQTWNYYNQIKEEVFQEDRDKLYILAIGPVSDILAYDLMKDGRRALDLGHLPKDYDAYKKDNYDYEFYMD